MQDDIGIYTYGPTAVRHLERSVSDGNYKTITSDQGNLETPQYTNLTSAYYDKQVSAPFVTHTENSSGYQSHMDYTWEDTTWSSNSYQSQEPMHSFSNVQSYQEHSSCMNMPPLTSHFMPSVESSDEYVLPTLTSAPTPLQDKVFKPTQQQQQLSLALSELVPKMAARGLKEGTTTIPFAVESLSKTMKISERRLYDILSVLEAIGRVTRGKLRNYYWHTEDLRVENAMKIIRSEANQTVNYAILQDLQYRNADVSISEKNLFKVEADSSYISFTGTQTNLSASWVVGDTRRNVLCLTQRVIMLIMLTEKGRPLTLAVHRRLYDILSTLRVLELVKEVMCAGRGKRSYVWVGQVPELVPGWSPGSLAVFNQTKKRPPRSLKINALPMFNKVTAVETAVDGVVYTVETVTKILHSLVAKRHAEVEFINPREKHPSSSDSEKQQPRQAVINDYFSTFKLDDAVIDEGCSLDAMDIDVSVFDAIGLNTPAALNQDSSSGESPDKKRTQRQTSLLEFNWRHERSSSTVITTELGIECYGKSAAPTAERLPERRRKITGGGSSVEPTSEFIQRCLRSNKGAVNTAPLMPGLTQGPSTSQMTQGRRRRNTGNSTSVTSPKLVKGETSLGPSTGFTRAGLSVVSSNRMNTPPLKRWNTPKNETSAAVSSCPQSGSGMPLRKTKRNKNKSGNKENASR